MTLTTSDKIEAIKSFRAYIGKVLKRRLYQYQKTPVDKIIESVCNRDGEEFNIEISRQAGKTEGITQMVIALATMFFDCFKEPLQIGIFSPQKEQSKTDFDRIKDYFFDIQSLGKEIGNVKLFQHEEKNGTTYELSDGKNIISKIYCFSASPTSNTESKTLDLIIIEEAHDVDDKKREKTIYPMGAARNATKVNIGVGGYKLCYFYKQIEIGHNCFIYDYEEVIRQKREAYKLDKNQFHLNYEKYIAQRLTKISKESDEFKTQYRLIWVLERGMFVTQDKLFVLRTGTLRSKYTGGNRLIFGCDSAKHSDDTVGTFAEIIGDQVNVLAWVLLHGDDYPIQVELLDRFIKDFYTDFRRVECVFDTTGNQDYIADSFKRMGYKTTYFVFDSKHKDEAYRFLDGVLKEGKLSYPKEECKERLLFEEQMLSLEKEFKTAKNYLLPHHPDLKGAKDDFCDSLAMVVWKARKTLGSGRFTSDFVGTSKSERYSREDKGKETILGRHKISF